MQVCSILISESELLLPSWVLSTILSMTTDHHREALLKEKVALAPMEPKRPHAITTSKFKG